MSWREADHPRHPSGSGRGGEFREKAGGWVAAAATAIRSPEQDLLGLVERGRVVQRTRLTGGRVAETSQTTVEDESGYHKLVHKIYSGMFAAQNAAREVVVAAIGQVIGARVPVTILDPGYGGEALYMEFLEGQTALEFAKVDSGYLPLGGDPNHSLLVPFQTSPSGRRLGLLDLLISNIDRHAGNWLIDEDGQVAGIDHSHVYLAGDRSDMDQMWATGTFTDSYLREETHVDDEGFEMDRSVLKPIEDLSRDEAVQIGIRLRALFEDDEMLELLAVANDKQPHARNGVQYAEALLFRWRAIAAETWGAER